MAPQWYTLELVTIGSVSQYPLKDQCVLLVLIMPHIWENDYQHCRMRQRLRFLEVLNYISTCHLGNPIVN